MPQRRRRIRQGAVYKLKYVTKGNRPMTAPGFAHLQNAP